MELSKSAIKLSASNKAKKVTVT